MKDTESRAETINKLIAKAERAGSEAEAEAFFEKAQDLMTRWAIDEAMLDSTSKEKADEIVSESIRLRRSGYFKMMVELYTQVASANSVRVLFRNPESWGENAGVILIGWKGDTERTAMLSASLLAQCVRESKRSMPEMYRNAGDTEKARWRRAFRMAYAIRIGQRLREQVERTRQDVASESGSDFLPVLVSREGKVDKFIEENFNVKEGRKSRSKYDPNGYNAGHAAADRADLGNTRVGADKKEIR